jgi:hypothetical protein
MRGLSPATTTDSAPSPRPGRTVPLASATRRRGPASSAPVGCPVCGGSRVRTDEVAHRELLRLAACLRCDHRWTEPLTLAPGAAGAASALPPSPSSEARPAA